MEEFAEAESVRLKFSGVPSGPRRGWLHHVEGGQFTFDLHSKRLSLTVRRERDIPMSHYQGASQIDVEAELSDGSVLSATGCVVLGGLMSDTVTVSLPLHADRLQLILPPDQRAS